MNKTIIILSGIPCSGKSTWTRKKWLSLVDQTYEYVSRDDVRDIFNKHQYTKESENFVTEKFNQKLDNLLHNRTCNKIILDNTHCKEKYINQIIKQYSQYNIQNQGLKEF